MNWFGISCGVIVYLMIGGFISGFLDISIGSDTGIFLFVTTFWPCIVMLIPICIIARVPVYLGKKLGDKYLPVIDNVLEKFFE